MEKEKIEMLKHQMNDFIENILNMAANKGKLDHFTIEMSNCDGQVNMKYVFKDRMKVY